MFTISAARLEMRPHWGSASARSRPGGAPWGQEGWAFSLTLASSPPTLTPRLPPAPSTQRWGFRQAPHFKFPSKGLEAFLTLFVLSREKTPAFRMMRKEGVLQPIGKHLIYTPVGPGETSEKEKLSHCSSSRDNCTLTRKNLQHQTNSTRTSVGLRAQGLYSSVSLTKKMTKSI